MKPVPSSSKDFHEEQTRMADDIDYVTIENKKKILGYLRIISTSYLSEISWECGISEYNAKMALNLLNNDGHVELLTVDPYSPDKRLLCRVYDQSMRGQGGYDHFSRKKWYALTEKGFRFLVGA